MKRSVILIGVFTALSIMSIGQTYYYQSGGNVSLSGKSYSSSITDTSGVLVTNSGIFTLTGSTVTTTGNSSNTNNSSQYGTNAGVLASLAATITFTGNIVPVKCYPNPASTILNILIDDLIPQKVSVFNVYGLKIFECIVTGSAAIGVGSWENGTYFISVNNKVIRIIVIH